eukprot:gene27179-biopygen17723
MNPCHEEGVRARNPAAIEADDAARSAGSALLKEARSAGSF